MRNSCLLLMILAACARNVSDDSPDEKHHLKVDMDTAGLDLPQTRLTTEEFISKIEAALRMERPATARRWVLRFPDLAVDALRRFGSASISLTTLEFIAEAYDACRLSKPQSPGWRVLIREFGASSTRFSAFLHAQQTYHDHLINGYPQSASRVMLIETARDCFPGLLEAEGHRLTGLALMLGERPQEAADQFNKAATILRDLYPHEAAEAKLLASEAARRIEQERLSIESWQESLLLAAALHDRGTLRPASVLWERLANLAPAQAMWTGEIRAMLQSTAEKLVGLSWPKGESKNKGDGFVDNDSHWVFIWTCIGSWRLERNEPQLALLAFARAQSQAPVGEWRERLRCLQAKALLWSGQRQAASGMLGSLALSPDPRTSAPALALRGTMELERGNVNEGSAILRRALSDPNIDWPDRASAEADLGLVYLLQGNEAEGLMWLRAAEDRMAKSGRTGRLVQCLENQMRYWERAVRPERVSEIRERIRRLENER
jgi:tetratricopeptide (TPR) repeat protein